MKAKSEKGHISVNILWNSLNSLSGYLQVYQLHTDPKLHAKYKNPSSSSL